MKSVPSTWQGDPRWLLQMMGWKEGLAWARLAAEGWEEGAGLWMYFEGRTKVFAGGQGFDEYRVPEKEQLATTPRR